MGPVVVVSGVCVTVVVVVVIVGIVGDDVGRLLTTIKHYITDANSTHTNTIHEHINANIGISSSR